MKMISNTSMTSMNVAKGRDPLVLHDLLWNRRDRLRRVAERLRQFRQRRLIALVISGAGHFAVLDGQRGELQRCVLGAGRGCGGASAGENKAECCGSEPELPISGHADPPKANRTISSGWLPEAGARGGWLERCCAPKRAGSLRQKQLVIAGETQTVLFAAVLNDDLAVTVEEGLEPDPTRPALGSGPLRARSATHSHLHCVVVAR
jgi:hypothetical protein